MPRLRHSLDGLLRAKQISRHQLFVYVEGPTDRAFYSALLDSCSQPTNTTYEIDLPEETPTFRGNGKQALLSLYRQLRKTRRLFTCLGAKPTAFLFLLDKDIDDILHKKARSPHVIYTEHYSKENYLFRHGNLITALAAACNLDTASIRTRITVSSLQWSRAASHNWQQWVEYCLLAARASIPNCRNFSLPSSLMHDRPYHALNPRSATVQWQRARALSGLSSHEFSFLRTSVSRHVAHLYSGNQQDRVFSGKWYIAFLAQDAEIIANGRTYSHKNLASTIPTHLVATLDYTEPWADYFRQAFSAVTSLL